MYSDIYRPISFKLFIRVESTELYILISVWKTLTSIRGHSCIGKKSNFWVHFLANRGFPIRRVYLDNISLLRYTILVGNPWNLKLVFFGDEIQYIATTCWLLKLMLNLFFTNHIQWRELGRHDFMKYTFNIVMCQDTCELICFKFDVMLNITIFYSLIPVWMTLMFARGYRITGKLELVQSFFCKVAWDIMMGKWLWRSPVSMANMDHLSIYSSWFLIWLLCVCVHAFKARTHAHACMLSWFQHFNQIQTSLYSFPCTACEHFISLESLLMYFHI